MMSEFIERLRYRFQLWRREQREDYFGTASSEPPEERDYVSHYSDPKRAVLLKESTIRSIGRSVGVFFGMIIIAAQICLVVGRFFPSARFTLAVVCLVFIGLWTLVSISIHIDLYKARRQYQQQQAIKSSNQTLQLTAARPDKSVSIHESAFTPHIPRFRQR